ncbi:MAG: NfeD family protein [Deltaproteobacteria bacterium]|nr:NfeD family protein [Deltaproteobacteria bacterium]
MSLRGCGKRRRSQNRHGRRLSNNGAALGKNRCGDFSRHRVRGDKSTARRQASLACWSTRLGRTHCSLLGGKPPEFLRKLEDMKIFESYLLFWFIMGFVFLLLEVLTPGVVFVFFGLGSWVIMLALLAIPLPASFQWIGFIVASALFLVFLRRHLTLLFNKIEKGRTDSLKEPMVANQYIGKEIAVISEITPEKPGLVELNGTNWQARSASKVQVGAMVRIIELEGLTLWVEPL